MNYMKIYKCTISDGPGVRTSLYVSGCRNHCPHCHNQESWDFQAGEEFSEDTVVQLLQDLDHDYIKGLTLCGGEPMEPENQEELARLVRRVKEAFPYKDIWCYTGYELSDLIPGGRKHTEFTDEMLSYIDVLIVGNFDWHKRDISDQNRWRGSTNQRVLDVRMSLKEGRPMPLDGVPNNEI